MQLSYLIFDSLCLISTEQTIPMCLFQYYLILAVMIVLSVISLPSRFKTVMILSFIWANSGYILDSSITPLKIFLA